MAVEGPRILEALRRSEERLRAIFANSPIGILVSDLDGGRVEANPALERFLGGSAAEFLEDVARFSHPEDFALDERLFRELCAGERDCYQMEKRYIRADGELVWGDLSVSLLRDAEGRPRAAFAMVQDITARKRAEAALHEREADFRSLIENVSDLIVLVDASRTIRYITPAVERVLGVAPAEATDHPVRDFIHPEDWQRLDDRTASRLRGEGDPERFTEVRALHRDGSWRVLQLRANRYDGSRWGPAIVVAARDVTEERRAEETARAAEQRARATAERMRAVAAAAAGVIGAEGLDELRDVLRSACARVMPLDVFWLALHEEETGSLAVLTSVAGESGWLEERIPLAGTPSERVVRERRSLRTLCSTDPLAAGAVRWAGGGPPESVIRTPILEGDRVLGILSVQSYTPDLYAAEDVEVLEAVASCGASALVNIHHLAERRRTEEALRDKEEHLRQVLRLEAVGRLAGGVAHDFNNILTVISGHAELLLEELAAQDALREDLDEIRRAAERATGLTRQLLAFSRKQVLRPERLDLSHTLTELEWLLHRLIGEDIELITNARADLGAILADPSQIEQVVVNLVVNARDAMPKGGRLVLGTDRLAVTERRRPQAYVAPGEYARLSVSDTGAGMDAATLARIFEPFFTTKPVGSGTGLGLSTVYGIVKQSGGYVWAESEPGRGSTFFVLLPLAPETAATPAATAPALPAARGAGTVLVAEDEREVRGITRRILERAGYTVLVAEDGPGALALSRRHAGPIDLLLTDVVMPRMSGKELADRITAERPETRVVYMTGYTDDAIVHHGVLDEGVALVVKPFTATALLQALAAMPGTPAPG